VPAVELLAQPVEQRFTYTVRRRAQADGLLDRRAVEAIVRGLAQAEQSGWLRREGAWIQPTARGFDFLSDLQQLFLPAA